MKIYIFLLTVIEKENQNLARAFDCGFFYPSSPEFAHKLNRNPVAMRRWIVDSASQRFQLMPGKIKITVSLRKPGTCADTVKQTNGL